MLNKDIETIAGGFEFPEGPCFDAEGRCHLVEMQSGWITRIGPAGKVDRLFNTGGSPNGLAIDGAGAMWIAEAGLGKLMRYAAGSLSEVVGEWDGRPLQGPNDLVFHPGGAIYMTGPGGSNVDTPVGVVYRIEPGGALDVVAEGMRFPNGLVLSADASLLYVAETCAQKILVFEVLADGSLSAPEDFAPTPGGVGGDGVCLDVEGNLYVAHFGTGTIPVFSPTGELLDTLPAGGMKPTNVAFGGDALEELWVTEVETNAVFMLTPGSTGLKPFNDPR